MLVPLPHLLTLQSLKVVAETGSTGRRWAATLGSLEPESLRPDQALFSEPGKVGLGVWGCLGQYFWWGLGASILAPSGTILTLRGHLGGLWKQQDGHEWFWNRIFSDFGLFVRLYFERFFGTESWNFNLISGLFPGFSFVLIFDSKVRRLGLLTGFRMVCIARTFFFIGIVFYRFRGRILLSFGALGRVFLTFAALVTGLKIDGFWVV